jgi:hypothetical protein
VRRELVNLKKVILNIYISGLVVERRLQMLSTFYFSDLSFEDGDGPAKEEMGKTKPRFEHRPRYATLATTLQVCSGTARAIHDARFITKSFCMIPRHPDKISKKPKVRLQRQAGASATSLVLETKFMANARTAVEQVAARLGLDPAQFLAPLGDVARPLQDVDESGMPARSTGRRLLDELMGAIHRALPSLPVHVLRYIECALIGRGLVKALWMAEELKQSLAPTTALQERLRAVQRVVSELQQVIRDKAGADGTKPLDGELLASTTQLLKHAKVLQGAGVALRFLVDALHVVDQASDSVSFVAHDLNHGEGHAMFVPAELGADELFKCHEPIIER